MVQTAVSGNTASPFERGQRVVCKPDAFAFASGVGEVRAIVYGNVIVYFESVGRAQVYDRAELDSAPIVQALRMKEALSAALKARMSQGMSVSDIPSHRLPLSTPVRRRSGIEGVISGHSTCDAQRYRVSFFDRHYWQVRQRWYDRGCFEVIGVAASATVAALTA